MIAWSTRRRILLTCGWSQDDGGWHRGEQWIATFALKQLSDNKFMRMVKQW
jgi:hypothetical protein